MRDERLKDMRYEVQGVDEDRAAAADQGLPVLVTAAAAGSEAAAAEAAAAVATPLVAHTHNLTSDVALAAALWWLLQI